MDNERFSRKVYLVSFDDKVGSVPFNNDSRDHGNQKTSLAAKDYPMGNYRVIVYFESPSGRMFRAWGPELTVGKVSAGIAIKDHTLRIRDR